MTDSTQLVLPNQQFWVLFIGTFVPLAGYLINKWAPWESETFKGIVQVVLVAIGGVAYTALAGDVHGVGDFLQQVFTAIISGLFAHNILWKPTGLNVVFGANRVEQEQGPAGFMDPKAAGPGTGPGLRTIAVAAPPQTGG
jgi:hypothetical protein